MGKSPLNPKEKGRFNDFFLFRNMKFASEYFCLVGKWVASAINFNDAPRPAEASLVTNILTECEHPYQSVRPPFLGSVTLNKHICTSVPLCCTARREKVKF